MKKRFCVAMAAMAVVLLTAGMTAAAKRPDLKGEWRGVVNFVGWNEVEQFYFIPFGLSLEIQDQDLTTGNFYGLLIDSYPFTGNVAANKVVTILVYGSVGEYRIITAKVTGKKMTGTMQHFKPGQIDTGTFTLYKE